MWSLAQVTLAAHVFYNVFTIQATIPFDFSKPNAAMPFSDYISTSVEIKSDSGLLSGPYTPIIDTGSCGFVISAADLSDWTEEEASQHPKGWEYLSQQQDSVQRTLDPQRHFLYQRQSGGQGPGTHSCSRDKNTLPRLQQNSRHWCVSHDNWCHSNADWNQAHGRRIRETTRRHATRPADARDWSQVEGCMSVDGSKCFTGPALIDTGISQMYMTLPSGTKVNRTNPPVLDDGSVVEVKIGPSANGAYISSEKFTVGDIQGMDRGVVPSIVRLTLADAAKNAPHVNTGRHFLRKWIVAFDSDGGYFGLGKTG